MPFGSKALERAAFAFLKAYEKRPPKFRRFRLSKNLSAGIVKGQGPLIL